jgi:hypothetical protein
LAVHDLGYRGAIGMVRVERQFIHDPQSDEERDRHACGQADEIDEGVYFAAEQVAPGDLEIVL